MAKVKKQNLKKKAKAKGGAAAPARAPGASSGGLVTNKKFGLTA